MQAPQAQHPRVRPVDHAGEGAFGLGPVARELRSLRPQQKCQAVFAEIFAGLAGGVAGVAGGLLGGFAGNGFQALLFGLLLALGFLDLLFLGHLASAFGAGDLGFGFFLGALFGARTGRSNGFIAWRSGFEFFQLGQLGFSGGLGAVFVIGEFEHRAPL
jgi:hypothetical protein